MQLAQDLSEKSGHWGGGLSVLYGMAMGCRAKNMLEIGVWHGGSTKALLCAAARLGGQLTSIDCQDCSKVLDDGWENLKPRWMFHQGWSLPLLKHLINLDMRYGLVLIDGEHTYETVSKELKLVDCLVKP